MDTAITDSETIAREAGAFKASGIAAVPDIAGVVALRKERCEARLGGWRAALLVLVTGGAALMPLGASAASAPAVTADVAVAAQVDSDIVAPKSAAQWMEHATVLRETQPVNWVAVRDAYEKAADLGSLPVMSHVGWIYEQGLLGEPELAEAVRWYAPVAEAGRDDFAIKLGWLYLQPELGPDRLASERWFQLAIERDSASARVALASVLVADAQGGLQIERIYEAHELLETALQQGHPLAARFLARIHVEQIGDYPSTEDSRLYYTRLAAESGQALMQGWLAQRYVAGDGVPQDRQEAAFWAALAAAGADPAGMQLHRSLQAQLSEEERRTVLERTMSWALQAGRG